MSKDEQEKDQFDNFLNEMDEGLTRFAIIKQAAPLLMPKLLELSEPVTRQKYHEAAQSSVLAANILANEIMKYDPARKLGGSNGHSSQD